MGLTCLSTRAGSQLPQHQDGFYRPVGHPDELAELGFGLPQCWAGTIGPRLQAGSSGARLLDSWQHQAALDGLRSSPALALDSWQSFCGIQTPTLVQPSPAFGCFHGPSFRLNPVVPTSRLVLLDNVQVGPMSLGTIGYRLTPTAPVVRFTQMLGNLSFKSPRTLVTPGLPPLPVQLLWTQMPDPSQWSPGPDWLAQTQDPCPPTQTQVPGVPSQTQAPGQPQ